MQHFSTAVYREARSTPGSSRRQGKCSSLLLIALALLLTSCANVSPGGRQTPPALLQASVDLKKARRITLTAETRAAYYMGAAALANAQLDDFKNEPKARAIYNSATAELTDLLRDANGGRLWNRPLEMTVNGTSYRLRFSQKTKKGAWSPNDFTDFTVARKVDCGHVRQLIREEGIGGTLVGIRKTPRRSLFERVPFEPKRGLVAPVTATLDFQGREAALTLSDPSVLKTARVRGEERPLAADFTAPIAFHPVHSEFWDGLKALINTDKFMSKTGLFMIHPYDPNRIPVILVHGLASTPQMWVNVINEVEGDPALRGRYQFWVFCYPTGNPPAYSALLCREQLAKMQKTHPMPKGFIMVGHSMGGLVSKMQATTTGRTVWNANFGTKADRYYQKLPADHVVKRNLIFNANPQVKKVVFICVPHRGSEMALGSIGAIGQRLITLPSSLVATLKQSIPEMLQTATGQVVLPNSITGLSPKNPTLLSLDKLPIQAPHYSIIGDRGKGDTPKSSDGVVPYWSSHLASARSERIVPGPHGSYELPETIAELKSILGDHLRTAQ